MRFVGEFNDSCHTPFACVSGFHLLVGIKKNSEDT